MHIASNDIVGVNPASEFGPRMKSVLTEHGCMILSETEVEGVRVSQGGVAPPVPVEEVVYLNNGEKRYAYILYFFDGVDAEAEGSIVSKVSLDADQIADIWENRKSILRGL